jgi:hypothetical protein
VRVWCRVDESTERRLEIRCTRKGTGGSNPSLSANLDSISRKHYGSSRRTNDRSRKLPGCGHIPGSSAASAPRFSSSHVPYQRAPARRPVSAISLAPIPHLIPPGSAARRCVQRARRKATRPPAGTERASVRSTVWTSGAHGRGARGVRQGWQRRTPKPDRRLRRAAPAYGLT